MMKKISVLLGASLLSLSAVAEENTTPIDALSTTESAWTMEVGADYWWPSNEVDEQDYSGKDSGSGYIDIQHDYPYMPNFKMRYTHVENDAISFDNIDYIAYYSVLQTEQLNFDVGVSATQFYGGQYSVAGETQEFNELEWAFYADGSLDIPGTGLSIVGDMQFGGSGDNSNADITAGLKYTFDLDSLDVILRGGYRVMDYQFDYFADEPVSVREQGFFTGAAIRF